MVNTPTIMSTLIKYVRRTAVHIAQPKRACCEKFKSLNISGMYVYIAFRTSSMIQVVIFA